MSQWDDYNADSQFAHDFPYDIPNEYWCMNNGKNSCKRHEYETY
jgi:hypothetical protein